MHPYGIDTHQRRNLIIWLIVISFLLAPLVTLIIDRLGVSYPAIAEYAIDPVSAAGIFYILVTFTEHYLWRNKIFRAVFGVTVPNLNGDWEGDLYSSWDDFTTPYPIKIAIRQEWSEIVVRLTRDGGSGSKSETASILLRAGVDPLITYTYGNDPEPHQLETMHSHDGTAILDIKLGEKPPTLEGTYYTGRDRRTFGRMKVTKVAKKKVSNLDASPT